MTRSYAILGTGAIGGFYGAKLQRAGFDVHFLLRSDYEYAKRRGLVVESIDGDITLPEIQAYNQSQDIPNCDVVVIALKTTHNHQLSELLIPFTKSNSILLILQNGLGVEPEVAKIAPNQTILGGLCFICSNKVGKGRIRHIDYGAITLGGYAKQYQPAGITDELHQIAEDFTQAGIGIETSENLLLTRWKKLVWNIPYNSLSVILDARTDELMQDSATRILVEEIMQEVVLGAAACDRTISQAFVDKMLTHTEKMKPYLTSMKLDFNHKRPLEIDAILGNPLRMAAESGQHLPRIETLYRQLQFLDQQNRDQ
ncbi:MAG: putative 2-dehydropantoate 2-reductase [Microcoleaceae cyanobacterium]